MKALLTDMSKLPSRHMTAAPVRAPYRSSPRTVIGRPIDLVRVSPEQPEKGPTGSCSEEPGETEAISDDHWKCVQTVGSVRDRAAPGFGGAAEKENYADV